MTSSRKTFPSFANWQHSKNNFNERLLVICFEQYFIPNQPIWYMFIKVSIKCCWKECYQVFILQLRSPSGEGTWWRHQMEIFFALLALCAGNSLVTSEFPAQRPVTRSFDVFFDLHLNKRLNKQPWGWWLKTPLCSLWRHRNDLSVSFTMVSSFLIVLKTYLVIYIEEHNIELEDIFSAQCISMR